MAHAGSQFSDFEGLLAKWRLDRTPPVSCPCRSFVRQMLGMAKRSGWPKQGCIDKAKAAEGAS